jgi:hypothetical protein
VKFCTPLIQKIYFPPHLMQRIQLVQTTNPEDLAGINYTEFTRVRPENKEFTTIGAGRRWMRAQHKNESSRFNAQ